MNFHNLSKVMDNINVHNKYLLTAAVAARARQISEDKSVSELRTRHPDEKPISLALDDMEEGDVTVQILEPGAVSAESPSESPSAESPTEESADEPEQELSSAEAEAETQAVAESESESEAEL